MMSKMYGPVDSSGVAAGGGMTEEEVQQIVAAGDIEQLAALVLAGEGETLARQHSSQPDVQMFINNVPIYMTKIQKVHKAMKEGNLRELQSALDRRKFAVARENTSPLRLTPLHVAVLYNRTPVLRFLASRFPETLQATDAQGRTPLHYAALLKDNRNYYNMLLSLGADKTVKDKDGKTAQYYLEHPEVLSREQILTNYEGTRTSEIVTQLKTPSSSDKAKEDTQQISKENLSIEPLESTKKSSDTQPGNEQEDIKSLKSMTKTPNTHPIKEEVHHMECSKPMKTSSGMQPRNKENKDESLESIQKTSDPQSRKEESQDMESSKSMKKSSNMQLKKKEIKDNEYLESNSDTQSRKEENQDMETSESMKKSSNMQLKKKEIKDNEYLESNSDIQSRKEENQDMETSESTKKMSEMQPKKEENKDDESLESNKKNSVSQVRQIENEDVESLKSLRKNSGTPSKEEVKVDIKSLELIQKMFDKLQLRHSKTPNLLGELLTLDVFNRYKNLKTKSGFTLLDVIKPGLKQLSKKPLAISIESSPIVLADKESVNAFKDLTVPVVLSLNGLSTTYSPKVHPKLLQFQNPKSKTDFSSTDLDPSSKVVKSCTIELSRNLKEFEFSHALSLQNLEMVELEFLEYFSQLRKPNPTFPKSLQGFSSGQSGYFSLSELSEPNNKIYELLKNRDLLDSCLDLSKRQEKNWPNGRGVFFHPGLNFAAWINVQEHLKIIISTNSRRQGSIGEIYEIIYALACQLEETLEFEKDAVLGYLMVNPQLIGNGMKFHVILQLPLVGEDFFDLQELCKVRDLLVEDTEGIKELHLMNRQTFGLTEFETFQKFSNAVINLIGLEQVRAKEQSSKTSKRLTNLFKKYFNFQ